MEMIGHGGKEIVERVLSKDAAIKRVEELKAAKVKTLDVRLQLATEILDLAYGIFSPLEGFMTKADVQSVCDNMLLADGKTVWSIPIVYDISSEDLEKSGIKQYDEVARSSLDSLRGRGIVQPEFLAHITDKPLREYPGYYGTMVWVLMMLGLWLSSRRIS